MYPTRLDAKKESQFQIQFRKDKTNYEDRVCTLVYMTEMSGDHYFYQSLEWHLFHRYNVTY
jgi:hypothetical protein